MSMLSVYNDRQRSGIAAGVIFITSSPELQPGFVLKVKDNILLPESIRLPKLSVQDHASEDPEQWI